MSSLFGGSDANSSAVGGDGGTASLTDSIFGPSDRSAKINSNGDLFELSAINRPRRPRHKRPRTKTKITAAGPFTNLKKEGRDETMYRRRRQAQDDILDDLTISRKDYADANQNMEELCGDVRGLMKHHGLVILRDALSEEEVAKITTIADVTRRHICNALDSKAIPYNSPINNTKTICFRELAVRCQGRMDVRYEKDGDENGDKKLLPLPLLDSLSSAVLDGAEPPNLTYAGWIFSFPKSLDQPWHQDGSPLFEKGTESLPSYAINVFCGLHDAKQSLEFGPTEFVVGSHHMDAETAMKKIDTAVSAVLGRGDVLLYDYRICHRGTANLSEKDDEHDIRKVMYLMYARPWFREHLNFGTKSLFD